MRAQQGAGQGPALAGRGEVVAGLNRLGVTPRDLITILQMIKAVGALDAEIIAQ